jgi:hypothetical protein
MQAEMVKAIQQAPGLRWLQADRSRYANGMHLQSDPWHIICQPQVRMRMKTIVRDPILGHCGV